MDLVSLLAAKTKAQARAASAPANTPPPDDWYLP